VYVCWRLCDAACKIHNTAFFRLDRCNTLSAAASKHVCVRYVLRSVCLAQTMRTMCARGLKQGVVPTCVLHRADWLLYFSFLVCCLLAVGLGWTHQSRESACLLGQHPSPNWTRASGLSTLFATHANAGTEFLEARGRARCCTTHTSQHRSHDNDLCWPNQAAAAACTAGNSAIMSSWLDGSLLTEGLKKIEEGLNQVDNIAATKLQQR
jgi:hypothetical protein